MWKREKIPVSYSCLKDVGAGFSREAGTSISKGTALSVTMSALYSE